MNIFDLLGTSLSESHIFFAQDRLRKQNYTSYSEAFSVQLSVESKDR